MVRKKNGTSKIIFLNLLLTAKNDAKIIGIDSFKENAIAPGPSEKPWNLPLGPTTSNKICGFIK